ncbi:MAG: hypothetical protein KAR07_09710 [Spirochaetes bacterium]|nr:hypothetical protein [Spirochaetota bacterium]
MGGWGCPHEVNGTCTRVKGKDCNPGMKGCILKGKVKFTNENDDKDDNQRKSDSREK